MILYDKSGLFLGMGNQELCLLGYEDMEEFRNYHNDFADLLVNKPGYIFKFKNFSWIDYALHSGTPNKRVLIKTKNGKEIETALNIHEIYLQKELNGSQLLFSVELTNAPFKHDLPLPMSESTSFTATSERHSIPKTDENVHLDDDAPMSTSSISFDSPLVTKLAIEDDYLPSAPLFSDEEPFKEETPSPLINLEADFILPTPSKNEPIEEPSGFKLKFDHDILETKPTPQEPKIAPSFEYNSIDQIKPDDLDLEPSLESYPDDAAEDILNDTNLFVPELKEAPTFLVQEEVFDLAECAEELGLDISALAQILEEYLSMLSASMPILTQAIYDNNRAEAKEEITKLKSVALHLQIIPLYHQFDHLETSLEFDTKEEIVRTLESLQKTLNHFRENVL